VKKEKVAMGIVKNILTIPPPVYGTSTMVAGAPVSFMPGKLYPGKLYNGHTRIFAEVAPGTSGEVKIKFSVEINSVDGATFNSWRNRISKIIGSPIEEEIDSYSGIASDPEEPERYASQFSLAAFSYVTKGDFRSYDNQSAVPFDPHQSLEEQLDPHQSCEEQLLESISRLDSAMIKLAGELTATTANPKSEAFIVATYFAFANKKVTSFAGYRGPIVLVHGKEEVVTQAGILAPV
jgi:hypothetical protein